MARIGIFGGSFNPIHRGHLHLIEVAREAFSLERVLLVPAYVSPFKVEHTSMASAEDRLAMCRLATASMEYVTVETCEIERGIVSYTVDTLRTLRARYPREELVLLMGSDAFLSLTAWREWKTIMTLATIGVVPREKGDFSILEEQKAKLSSYGTIYLCNSPVLPISSTIIRDNLRNPQKLSCYLDEKVVQYIEDKGVYGDARDNASFGTDSL